MDGGQNIAAVPRYDHAMAADPVRVTAPENGKGVVGPQHDRKGNPPVRRLERAQRDPGNGAPQSDVVSTAETGQNLSHGGDDVLLIGLGQAGEKGQ